MKNRILQYAYEKYDTSPEHPWLKYPDYAILRHKSNNKWYAVFMNIPLSKLGFESEDMADIIDVKCSPILISGLVKQKGYFPAYHMNKNHWITVILDGSVGIDKIIDLLDMSYDLTK